MVFKRALVFHQCSEDERVWVDARGVIIVLGCAVPLSDRLAGVLGCAVPLSDRPAGVLGCAVPLSDRLAGVLGCAVPLSDRLAGVLGCAVPLSDRRPVCFRSGASTEGCPCR